MSGEQQVQAVRAEEADRGAEVREGTVKGALGSRSVLGGHQSGAGPFAGEAHTLACTAHTQDDNRHAADLLITGQAAHQEGGDTHGQQSNHQRLLAAHLVTEVTEQHGAERTSQEGDSECGERHNLSQCRIGDVGEEDRAEVAGGCDGVTVVVIELDGSTHHRSGDDLRNRILLHGFRHGRSCTCRHNPFSLLTLRINLNAAHALHVQCFTTVLPSLKELSTATGMREKNWL